ncbi:hypothetical protein B0T20DRAFT_347316 [Sordaria brevicollis]|uniref:Uncharacterized protein n=1 Tax=Sordaria brevicollis TaxID=83679 RepID=A0AAE0PJ38_SORBR|nr:hypothetical protein B0T20DRAFT_347316 [Sordaria brevicollis]
MEEPGMGKPLPPLPVPLSDFSTYSQHPSKSRTKVRCLHSVMTCFYSTHDRCDKCKRKGPFGWLYRCIVDRDAIIMARRARGIPVAFDDLGCAFAEKMTLGKHGPDVRREDYSFLNEITPEQMASYTPSQIRKILSQRENVKDTISKERRRSCHSGHEHAKKRFPDDNQPWIPSRETECTFIVCHSCHPSATEKNHISIDAVANDDIRPTVAVGYGFSKLQSRPYVKADIVRNIGYRPVSLPINRHEVHSHGARSSQQIHQALDLADRYPEAAGHDGTPDDRIKVTPRPPYCPGLLGTPGNSQLMTGLPTNRSDTVYSMGLFTSSFYVRPPWTPPPTPLCTPEDGGNETKTFTDLGSYFIVCNGRSPVSLKVNPIMRDIVFSSVTASPSSERQEDIGSLNPKADVEMLNEDETSIQTEEQYNPSHIPNLMSKAYVEACTTPLPQADLDEVKFFGTSSLRTNSSLRRHRSQSELGRGQNPPKLIAGAEKDEETTVSLSFKPITLLEGVAITEEAAELGTPDVCLAVEMQPVTPAYPKQGEEPPKL